MAKSPDVFRWLGNDVIRKVRKASGRAIVAVGETVVSEAKQNVHREEGTLSRSIHVTPKNYNGDQDVWLAGPASEGKPALDLQAAGVAGPIPTLVGPDLDPLVWVGTWIPYAAVEEIVRGHRFMAPALEVARQEAVSIFQQAFREEGLRDPDRRR